MSMKNRLFASAIALFLAVGFSLPALAGSSRAEGAISQLESRADGIRNEVRRPEKKGVATISKLRNQVRVIKAEIAHLEAGGEVDEQRIAALLGGGQSARLTPVELAQRAASQQAVNERRLAVGPKIGARHRQAINEDLERLDALIVALESGQEADADALGDLLGIMIADSSKSPEDRLRSSQVKLATMKRKLGAGPKLGMATRAAIRDEIEALDSVIERLEEEVNR